MAWTPLWRQVHMAQRPFLEVGFLWDFRRNSDTLLAASKSARAAVDGVFFLKDQDRCAGFNDVGRTRYCGATQPTGDGGIQLYRVPHRLKTPRTAPGALVADGPRDGRRGTRGLPAVSFYFSPRKMEIAFMTFKGRPFPGWLRTGDPRRSFDPHKPTRTPSG
jgi:hypothetical protein